MGNNQPRQARLAKTQRQKKVIRMLVVLALLLLALGSAGLAYSRARDLVLDRLIQVEVVREGVLEQTETVTGLILHQATMITSPAAGKIDFLVPEGERVRVGTVIARVKTVKGTADVDQVEITVKSPRAGVVCYHPDGLETLAASAQILEELTPAAISALQPEPVDVRQKDHFEAGEPIARIIDNLSQMLIYVEFPVDLFEQPLEEGDSIRVVVGDGQDSAQKARIAALKSNGSAYQVILSFPTCFQELIDMRILPLHLVVRRFTGTLVPVEALVPKDGKTGVYVVRKGTVRWCEVEEEGRLGEQAAVKGIGPGTRIVLNPGLTAEGELVE